MRYDCQNCEAQYENADDLLPIKDVMQRVAPGEFMPAGECPECGAVCHSQEQILETVKEMFGMKSFDWPDFRQHKAELESIIAGSFTGKESVNSLVAILAVLVELQEQAVTYGYSQEEVYG